MFLFIYFILFSPFSSPPWQDPKRDMPMYTFVRESEREKKREKERERERKRERERERERESVRARERASERDR